ncbi:MAG: class II glutamine amidotransferase [Flavobacteriales bacterium]|jgi:amidophosphoribosyltransferase|tara:strand:- start:401 stop:2299 length:1899 start_codon:yes stop_codon:yes gene_type:complete
MSDSIKHECGIALLRLKKPLDFYLEKYGTAFYGLRKMYLLMEKQHNRGQDGSGLANIKLDMEPGSRYVSRSRFTGNNNIQRVFEHINTRFDNLTDEQLNDTEWLKNNKAFTGEVYLGHLRYGTYGKNSVENTHPFHRANNWMTKNLILAGNFNLTNVDELFDVLVNIGQHPKEKSDTVTILEKIGHFLDVENEILFEKYKALGYDYKKITELIIQNIDIQSILKNSSVDWDGGYAMAGILGHGDAFVFRDPNGIRPAYWYEDDEIAVATSERPVIQTVFNVPLEDIKEVSPGSTLIIKKNGEVFEKQVLEPKEKKSCSFERIYFSRGSDQDIYKERKELGNKLVPQILKSINQDLKNSVFTFIPNTAETAFYGMIKGIDAHLNQVKIDEIQALGDNKTPEALREILEFTYRAEKIAIKDAKLRTFITQDDDRDELVAHVYDLTYGTVNEGKDNLIVVDDSIVRGTTLRTSILKMLGRLKPKKIVVVSSAPQIRYPDCYGIDMSKMGDFIAFQAAIALLKESGREGVIDDVYKQSIAQAKLPKEEMRNFVKDIYASFTPNEISAKIAEILTPDNMEDIEVEIIYQTLEGLHASCPDHNGDWYFSGDYPTPGGNKAVNQAFINYYEGKNVRAYC